MRVLCTLLVVATINWWLTTWRSLTDQDIFSISREISLYVVHITVGHLLYISRATFSIKMTSTIDCDILVTIEKNALHTFIYYTGPSLASWHF